MSSSSADRYRGIFRRIHARHPACITDEWLSKPCADSSGTAVDRPIVWSRRNGPWQQHDVIFIGAAPGNAGGMGRGSLGAHGTRIPFGGDIAGANLDALLGSIGLDRNHTFIIASLNQLPARGGGEPTAAELLARVGDYDNSLQIVRDTILAAGPRLVVALGNIAMRSIFAAVTNPRRLPSLAAVQKAGATRNHSLDLASVAVPEFRRAFEASWQRDLPALLWLTHPSGQNMSPFARSETFFHTRMIEARDALQSAARKIAGLRIPKVRPEYPDDGIYALPEWHERIGPRHAELDALWRAKGV